MNEKSTLFYVLVVIISLLLVFSGVQTCRLQSDLQQLEHYRTELSAAHDRQSDIAEIVGRAGEILGTTANTVAELRKQIQEVEDCYNQLWEYCSSFDGYTTNSYGDGIKQ